MTKRALNTKHHSTHSGDYAWKKVKAHPKTKVLPDYQWSKKSTTIDFFRIFLRAGKLVKFVGVFGYTPLYDEKTKTFDSKLTQYY